MIHARVREEPSYSVLLRAGFVKLASILDVPLTRINEVGVFLELPFPLSLYAYAAIVVSPHSLFVISFVVVPFGVERMVD